MLRKAVVAFLFLASVTSSIARADTIDTFETANQSEREMRWIWKYIGDFVRDCNNTPGSSCQDAEIKAVVTQLATILPSHAQPSTSTWGQRLIFVAEKDHPELFQTVANEAHRFAMTERKADASIYINSDRMKIPALQWVGLLVHESVHHLGYDDDARRLPDRVGAAVATFVTANWQESSLADYGQPLLKVISYSNPNMTSAADNLVENPVNAVDNSAVPNDRVPICKPNETFVGQTVGSMLWRVAQLRGDQKLARIRGSARVTSACRDSSGSSRQVLTNFTMLVDLNFATTFRPQDNWWLNPSKLDPATLAAGNDDSQAESVDIYRTFAILSVKNETPTVNAGGVWNVSVAIQGTDDFQPGECGGVLSGSTWFFERMTSTTMFDVFDSCQVSKTAPNKWLVSLGKTIPANAQPDLFAINFIYFNGVGGPRFAVPARPKYVEVKNPSAAKPVKISAMRLIGLQKRSTLEGHFIPGGVFSAKAGQTFALEFDVIGTQQLKRQFFDLDQWVGYDGSFVTLASDADVTTNKELVTNITTTPIPGGTRVHYDMTFPQTASGYSVGALKIRGLNLETDDYSWAQINSLGPLENFIVTDLIP